MILALETSGKTASVALLGPAGAEELELPSGGRHESGLGGACRELLARHSRGLEGISALAVGRGPGSFTGVRIGVSFAKMLAYATGKPLVGICSLAARAAEVGGATPLAILLPAHPGQVYGAVFTLEGDRPRPLVPVALWSPEELLAAAPPGTRACAPDTLDLPSAILREPWPGPATARAVVHLAAAHLAAGDPPDNPFTLEPLYAQPSAPERG